MDWLTNNSMRMMEKSLDYVWQRQQIISQNIANVETPGYKAKYLTFEDTLRQKLLGAQRSELMRGTKVQNAIESTSSRVHTSSEMSTKLDGNNVNIDAENVELARTQLQYDYLIRQISDQFTRLRAVIKG